jgi:hypothetical protein
MVLLSRIDEDPGCCTLGAVGSTIAKSGDPLASRGLDATPEGVPEGQTETRTERGRSSGAPGRVALVESTTEADPGSQVTAILCLPVR